MQEEKLCEELTWESMYGRDSVEEYCKPYLGTSSVEALINVVTRLQDCGFPKGLISSATCLVPGLALQ